VLILTNLTRGATRPYAPRVSNEKRSHPRAPIELKVEYKKMNTFFADYTKNISKGGTFIKTDRPLPVGTEFLFKLTLPKRGEPFQLKGVVMWTNQPDDIQRPDTPQMGMGIRFIFEKDEHRQMFEGEVEDLMVQALGRHLYDKLVTKPPAKKG
jgi:type IV pilus assembly protein PilZ